MGTTYATGIDPKTGEVITQAQPDWAQKNSYAPDFIKNKGSSSFVQQNADWAASAGVTAILNKPVFPPGLLPSSMPKASDVGILANGSDQTSIINSVLANSNYSGIILDNSPAGAYVISGTLNGGGKTIIFYPGNYFSGTGTINNLVISAGYIQKCFDVTVSLTNCLVTGKYFSVKWYGALGNNSADDITSLQKSSDTVISNTTMTRDLYVPPGVYKTSKPWMLHKWNGTTYGQFTINVIGDWRLANANVALGFPRIIPTFKDGPAIGVQRATSGMILGLSIEGAFTSSLVYDTFVNTTWAAANTTGMRDSQYSPACGIGIDPVTNDVATIPPDGGYPPLNGSGGGTNWYRGDGSSGGTTDFLISDCHIVGFTVDILYSVSGDTQQGEDCIIQNCRLEYCNVAVSYTQTQNDNCHIKNCRSWSQVWVVIDTRMYGVQKGLAPSIHGYNVAGTVNTLFNIGSIKPFIIENFYAESFLTMGTLVSGFNGSSVQGNFNFGLSDFTPQYHIKASNVKFQDSTIRYYDDLFNKRIRLSAPSNVIFENVMFDLPPFEVAQQASQTNTARYINCSLPGVSEILGMNSGMFFLSAATISAVLYGQFKMQDGLGGNETLSLAYNCASFNRLIGFTGAITVTVSGTRDASFTVSAGNALLCRVNDIVVDDATKVVLGRISNISGTTITISEIPMGVVTGTYTLDLVYYVSARNNCVGDVTSGSPNITNVSALFPATGINNFGADFRFDSSCFPAGAYILSYNSGTNVIVMSANSNKTATKQNFFNGSPYVEVVSPYAPSSATVNTYNRSLPTGGVWLEQPSSVSSSVSSPNKWIFNLGGFVSATTLSLGAAYQADFNLVPEVALVGGVMKYFDNTSNTWVTI